MAIPGRGSGDDNASASAASDGAPKPGEGRGKKRRPAPENRGTKRASPAGPAAGESSGEGDARRAKLLALKRALENGTYRVEPEKVAQALMKELRVLRERE